MAGKTERISGWVDPDTKKKFHEKAKSMGLSDTELIEKVANSTIIFIDDNVKNLLEAIKLMPVSK